MSAGRPGRGRRAARLTPLPLAGGALVGLSLPPVGWWPLGIVGVALIVSALFGRRLPVRVGVGMLAGIGQFFISLAWALQFNTAGYIVLAIVEAAFLAVACAFVPPGRGRFPAAVAMLTLAEWARQTWPFGGLPLGGIALGQASGPIAPAARLGGSLLVAGMTFLGGTSLAALCAPVVVRWTRRGSSADDTAGAVGDGATGAGAVGNGATGAGAVGDGGASAGAVGDGGASAGAVASAGDAGASGGGADVAGALTAVAERSPGDGASASGDANPSAGSERPTGRGGKTRGRHVGRAGNGSGWAAGAGSALAGLVGAAVVVAVVIVGRNYPALRTGMNGGTGRVIRVAVVQGGGRRGLSQLQVPASVVLSAAVRETSHVPPGVSLILWPEDVVSLNRSLAGSPDEAILASLARRHHATLVAGVTEPVGTTRFRNEIVAFSPSGHLVAEFEKVHRVPFGEYVPWRGFFAHFANLNDVPRDAIPGHGTGMIATPAGRFAVLVSFEVFFGDRGRSGVRAGGEVVLVPTNTSSYSNDQAPAQEIAASRLQALEEGRFVLQAAPTGYSAVVNPAGDVLQQTQLSKPAVLVASVPLEDGSTVFVRAGNVPALLAALVALLGGWAAAAFSRRGRRPRHLRRSPSR